MIKTLFATPFYEAMIDAPDLIAEVEDSCRMIATEDRAGVAWSKEKGYPGYTSYASLNDLPQRDPAFDDLKRLIDKHVRAFAEAAHFDLGGRKPKLDSIWINVLKPRGGHSGHIHPHSIISGTVYLCVPEGAGPLKIEDPRLPLMMAAPGRRDDAPEGVHPFFYAQPKVGTIFLWESWLRHEVPQGTAKSERISVSFNYK